MIYHRSAALYPDHSFTFSHTHITVIHAALFARILSTEGLFLIKATHSNAEEKGGLVAVNVRAAHVKRESIINDLGLREKWMLEFI